MSDRRSESETDEIWLERLWHAHAGSVRAYLQRRSPASAVDDVLAETFVVAWRRRNTRPAKELAWLYGIARKTLSTHLRGADRRDRLAERARTNPEVGPDDFWRSDLREEIVAALRRVSSEDRELLLLLAWEGLSPAEIAIATGSNGSAVRMRLTRARRRFEKALADAPTETEGAKP